MIALKKSTTGLVVAGLMLGMVQTSNAELKCTPHLAKWSGVAFLVASAVALYKRKPVSDFTPRYDVKEITKVKNIITKDYWKNIWHLYYDGFVGQKSTESHLKADDGMIVVEADVDAQGILGNMSEFVKPIKDAATSLGLGYLVYKKVLAHPSNQAMAEVIEAKSKTKDALHNH